MPRRTTKKIDTAAIIKATAGGAVATLVGNQIDKMAFAQKSPFITPMILEGVGLAGLMFTKDQKLDPVFYGIIGAAGAELGQGIAEKVPGLGSLSRVDSDQMQGWLKNKMRRIKKDIKRRGLSPKQVAKKVIKEKKSIGRDIIRSHDPRNLKEIVSRRGRQVISRHKRAGKFLRDIHQDRKGRLRRLALGKDCTC